MNKRKITEREIDWFMSGLGVGVILTLIVTGAVK